MSAENTGCFYWTKTFIKYLLSQPEANSRFIFLLQGVAGAIGILAIGICFVLHVHHLNDGYGAYPDMILALSACTGSAAAGRWLTKKVGPVDTSQTQQGSTQQQ